MTTQLISSQPSQKEEAFVTTNASNKIDESKISNNVSSLGVSEEVWNIFLQTKDNLSKEKEIDFSESITLRVSSLLIMPITYNLEYTGPAYEPIYPTKSMERAAQREREKSASNDNNYFEWYSHLKERIDDLSSRDEAWVGKTYSLGNSKEDKLFAEKMASDYKIITELADRFAIALKKYENQLVDKSLLNVSV